MRKKSVNASEVAKRSGVSQSTVSRVFTPGSNVAEKTRQKVLKAAKELNYLPNALARGLIMNKSSIVGIAMKENQNPFYQDVLTRLTNGLHEKGYQVLFVYTKNDEIEHEDIYKFMEYSVEGVIITDAFLSSEVAMRLSTNHIPFVLLNRYNINMPCHAVCCDNYKAAEEIAFVLYEKGYRTPAYITGKLNTSTNNDRKLGFFNAWKSKGITPLIEEGDYTYEGGFKAARNLLNGPIRPDAVFAANDVLAFGAMDAMKARGVKIPKDIAVVGFDNIKMASWISYSLTTWEQPVEDMVNLTIQKLLNEINGQSEERTPVFLPGKLIIRNTI
ncbi:LacI family DNA-binding transcriptional regulator [Halalkalibacter oceani]|uniref:LacI family DNA-binding transcriptional regulator n=1 Tax=Halalkalibacter oceani TaxID=1653776 RepID=UPI003398A39E